MKKLNVKNNFTKSNQNGITLIALIVTIIVLIIIAGISIATLTADNGVLRQTNLAKVQQMEANAREQVSLACAAMRVAISEAHAKDNSYTAKGNASLIQTKLKELIVADTVGLDKDSWDTSDLNVDAGTFNITYDGDDYKQVCNDTNASITFEITLGQKSIEITDETNSTLKDQNGNSVEIDIGAGSTEEGGSGSGGADIPTVQILSEVAAIGDCVNYDPTIGTNVTAENTTYTSNKGSASSHGNGSGSQKFSASNYKNANGKWKILNIEGTTVTLISDLIYQDSGDTMGTTGLTLNGAISYLWSEEELNRIAAIYGYGNGADTTRTITYYYGGPNDQDGSITSGTVESQQGRKTTLKIDGSTDTLYTGARAITEQDIIDIFEIDEYTYAEKNKSSANFRYYPTINGTSSTGLNSSTPSYTGKLYNTYSPEFLFVNTDAQKLIDLQASYWLSTRAINARR